MTKIERTRRTKFKRVASARNMVQVQFGAAIDQPLHGHWLECAEHFGIALQGFEELTVANERHLERFHVARAFVARGERGEQAEIVYHRKGRREGADKAL